MPKGVGRPYDKTTRSLKGKKDIFNGGTRAQTRDKEQATTRKVGRGIDKMFSAVGLAAYRPSRPKNYR